MNKRERVLTTLDLEEPDMIPIHSLGFEPTGTAYQEYFKSADRQEKMLNHPIYGDLTEPRFWNADIWSVELFKMFTNEYYPSPPEFPDCMVHFTGRMYRMERRTNNALPYRWYLNGFFTSPEIVHSIWAKYGKPIDLLNQNENYSRNRWGQYVDTVSPDFFPMAWLTLSIHEGLFEGMTVNRLAYYMRKNPHFIHELVDAFLAPNLELVKRFAEAGVEVIFYSDDLGQKDRSILSLSNFRTFILPAYQKLYDACKKYGMYIVQHSCGYIDELLPDLVDAGLDCIQALEPTAGVKLAALKERLGDQIAFMGGMDSSRILTFGTSQEIEADVKKCIQAAAKNGGYFAGPNHTLLDIPWSNVLTFKSAIEKYRKYPIR